MGAASSRRPVRRPETALYRTQGTTPHFLFRDGLRRGIRAISRGAAISIRISSVALVSPPTASLTSLHMHGPYGCTHTHAAVKACSASFRPRLTRRDELDKVVLGGGRRFGGRRLERPRRVRASCTRPSGRHSPPRSRGCAAWAPSSPPRAGTAALCSWSRRPRRDVVEAAEEGAADEAVLLGVGRALRNREVLAHPRQRLLHDALARREVEEGIGVHGQRLGCWGRPCASLASGKASPPRCARCS